VAGTQEPIYGPSAIKSVAVEAEKKPYTELSRDDMKWQSVNSSSTAVETQSFYLLSDDGHIALAQIIYSNVAYGKLSPVFLVNMTDKRPQWHPYHLPVQLQDLLPRGLETPPVVGITFEQP
jgi:hypothetical protein